MVKSAVAMLTRFRRLSILLAVVLLACAGVLLSSTDGSASASVVSMYSTSTVPTVPASNDRHAAELGTTFHVTEPGTFGSRLRLGHVRRTRCRHHLVRGRLAAIRRALPAVDQLHPVDRPCAAPPSKQGCGVHPKA